MWILVCSFLALSSAGRGVRLNDHVGYYETQDVKASFIASSQTKLAARFSFSAHGRSFKFIVKTHPTLFHPDFSLQTVDRDGQVKERRPNMRHLVTGYIEGEDGSLVYGRIIDGAFDGVIHSKVEAYYVDPLHHHPSATSYHNITAGRYTRVVYKLSDVNYRQPLGGCAVGNSTRMRTIQLSGSPFTFPVWHRSDHLVRRSQQSGRRTTCTVRIVADNKFFVSVGGGSESNTLEEMSMHILAADSIYFGTVFDGNGGSIQGSRLSVHSSMIYSGNSNNPLIGDYNTDELLEAFSEQNFDDVCLGHLFTYRDFQGTIGLAYLGDPNGKLAGGICQKRTRTYIGEVNLNTGFTSLLNFGRKLSRAVSLITTAHEIGHSHGAEHDPAGECFNGKYIMYPYATSGKNREFSSCSKSSIGRTIEVRGSCFIQFPSRAECGNGVIEEGEECDCGQTVDQDSCSKLDNCCLINCTLKSGANCSSQASSCCLNCQPINNSSHVCLKGDLNLDGGGCQNNTFCVKNNPNCPEPTLEADGKVCNNGSNVCQSGACTGSPCSRISNGSSPCYCNSDKQLCHVCCSVNDACKSSFEIGMDNGRFVAPNYPCKDFTGYCTEDHMCKGVNNDDLLNNLRNILLDFSSMWNWVKGNWYWVLVSCVALIVLIVLLQVTYRRKKLSVDGEATPPNNIRLGRNRRAQTAGMNEEVPQERTGLISRQTRI